jgi:hypothetical protein
VSSRPRSLAKLTVMTVIFGNYLCQSPVTPFCSRLTSHPTHTSSHRKYMFTLSVFDRRRRVHTADFVAGSSSPQSEGR